MEAHLNIDSIYFLKSRSINLRTKIDNKDALLKSFTTFLKWLFTCNRFHTPRIQANRNWFPAISHSNSGTLSNAKNMIQHSPSLRVGNVNNLLSWYSWLPRMHFHTNLIRYCRNLKGRMLKWSATTCLFFQATTTYLFYPDNEEACQEIPCKRIKPWIGRPSCELQPTQSTLLNCTSIFQSSILQ